VSSEEPWVVWSFEHDGWWGPGRFGYVRELAEAGHYTREEAQRIERQANEYTPVVNERALPLAEAEVSGPPKE
jgi:hypothetical protein